MCLPCRGLEPPSKKRLCPARHEGSSLHGLIFVMLEQKTNIIHFHLKIAMFYSREKMNYWPVSINLQVFKKSSYSNILSFKFVINDCDRYSNKATNQSHKL